MCSNYGFNSFNFHRLIVSKENKPGGETCFHLLLNLIELINA